MWSKILVPHDFSECAGAALAQAVAQARVHGSVLTLLHVSPVPPNVPDDALITPPGASAPIGVAAFMKHGAAAELEAIAEPLRRAGLLVSTVALSSRSGDVASEICDAAGRLGADVIVMATHGRTGIARVLLGSVAEKIVRHATVPVLTVRSPSANAAPTREESIAEDETGG